METSAHRATNLVAALPRARCFLRGSRARPCRASPRHPFRMSRQRLLRCCPAAFALQRAFRRACAFSRRLFAAPGAPLGKITLRLTFCSFFAALWRRQLYSSPPRLGETNGDGLLRRSGAVFAFPNVFHFFAHKLARLSRRRFAFALVFARAFDCFFFCHTKNVSPLTTRLDVGRLFTRSAPSFAAQSCASLISAHLFRRSNCSQAEGNQGWQCASQCKTAFCARLKCPCTANNIRPHERIGFISKRSSRRLC